MELDPKHPGINDAEYIARRQFFYDTALDFRLNNKGLPNITYTPSEQAIWQLMMEKLDLAHNQYACEQYLSGKKQLGLDNTSIPDLPKLNNLLKNQHNVSLVPAEGLLSMQDFFGYLSNRVMPVTQFLRHGSDPQYTPEPDAMHDIIGHVPPLMDKEYAELVELFGQGVRQANEHQLIQWQRMYWFTIEFGLIRENNKLKVFGAGLLSSFGEMAFCFSDKVDRIDFDLEKIINTDYDPTQMQNKIFILESINQLKQAVLDLIQLQTTSPATT